MKYLRASTRHDHRRTGNALIIVAMLLCLCILTFMKAKYCSAPFHQVADGELETSDEQVKKSSEDRRFFDVQEDEDDEVTLVSSQSTNVISKPLCTQTSKRSKVCEAEGEIKVHASSQTIMLNPSITQQQWQNKPYCRHHDTYAMKNIKEWTMRPISNADDNRNCTITHSVPALVFSVGGFTGNLFHDFTDVIIPLFISAYRFRGEVQFVIADVKPWWVSKFTLILKQLSNYDFIDANGDGDEIRCFPKVIVGLDFHKELGIDSSKTPGNYSIDELKDTLRKAFTLERSVAEPTGEAWDIRQKPRLLIISRKKTRVFLNERGMTDMAMSLGFDVKVAEPEFTSDIAKFARLVNSADVVLGVHGAGLTNMVFLPTGAVVIQVVPMGTPEWLARDTFGNAAPAMRLIYMEYNIQSDESTLSQQYPKDHPVITDPASIHKQGWAQLSKIYLENQDVKPHLGRLRKTLMEALKFLPHIIKKDGQ